MSRRGRRTFLVLGAAAAGYAGLRALPDLWQPELEYELLARPAGFRRVAGGPSSSAYDPFFGMAKQEDPADLATEQAVRDDLCGALYGGLDPAPGAVPVALFSDYYCPYCRVLTKTLARIEAESRGGIAVAWHELPLLGEGSDLAARAALAAKRQGAYPAFQERLMKSAFRPTDAYLADMAAAIAVDLDRLRADMTGPAVTEDLRTSSALARVFGFVGTPAMVIGRTVVQGQADEAAILAIAEEERKENWASRCLDT